MAARRKPPKTSSKRRTVKSRLAVAEYLADRLQGMTIREIAAKHSVSRSGVHEAIVRQLDEVTRAPALEVVQLELARIDRLQAAAMKRALDPRDEDQVKAIEVARRLHETKREFLGWGKGPGPWLTDLLGINQVGGAEGEAVEALRHPIGRIREVLLEVLRSPTDAWRGLLRDAGLDRGIVTVEGEAVDADARTARALNAAASMLGEEPDT